MIQIKIPESEYFNESSNEFILIKPITLKMEHSLISIKNWESKWNVAFLGKEEKTNEQMIDYLRCMTISPGDVKYETYLSISQTEMTRISEYIKAPMTATKFYDEHGNQINRETITAEIIYYWMVTLNIPFELQKVHLNQLLTLIRVTSVKNTPPKKMSKSEIIKRNNRINDERRKRFGITG